MLLTHDSGERGKAYARRSRSMHMSMSEFDNLLNGWDNDVSHHEMQDQSLPEDFSMEDIAFAEELESLLALDEEKMPPYFVQTLLDAEDERFQPASRQFEQKTHAEVFRRLKLKRRLFQPYKPSLQMMKDTFSLRRPIVALLTACILFMLMTMVATSTSFASGLNVLLSGAHGGALQVSRYPY